LVSENVEGTFRIEGLLEGRLPHDPEVADHLEDWVAVARDVGLRFDLEIEVGSFNLLPDARPVDVQRVGGAPADTLLDLLNQLLDTFPEDERVLTSTLHSTEVQAGRELQTIYAIGPTGRFERSDRTVSSVTRSPQRPLSRRQMLVRGGIGLGIALLLLIVASFFVEFRSVWNRCTTALSALDVDNIEIDATRFKDYFTVEEKGWASRGRHIVLTLRRTGRFPTNDETLEALRAEADTTLRTRLTLEDIARGYVRCELYDPHGEFIAPVELRIADLRSAEIARAYVPIPSRVRLGRVLLTH
jgi:hypothetical protein